MRSIDARWHLFKLLNATQSFNEDDIRTGLHIGVGPVGNGVKFHTRPGIRARHNLKIRVPAGIYGSMYLLYHFVTENNFLARVMPTLLRHDLVFKLKGAGATAFQNLDGMDNIHGITKAGVGILRTPEQ